MNQPSPAVAQSPLAVSHIHKSYHSQSVLNDINLELQSGEIFGLIGLNGAGKTTLIKIILDLVKADSGESFWFGMPGCKPDARSQIAYLPEKFQPSRYLKGMEYLSLSLAYYGMVLDHEKAKELAVMVDLDPEALDKRVGKYSKGMAQKLGLLGTLMAQRPLLLLDEPMSGLDPRSRIRLKEALQGAKQEGKTVFFSSHILSDLDEICDRIAVLHNGKLLYIGSPAEFKIQHQKTSLEQAFLACIDA